MSDRRKINSLFSVQRRRVGQERRKQQLNTTNLWQRDDDYDQAHDTPYSKKLMAAHAETKPTNPKDRAAVDRLDMSLFPDTAIAYGALAFTEGDLKYGGYNYRVGGVNASVYYAATKRHLAKWYNGSEVDPKTEVHHLANALACIAVIIDALEAGVLNDDRPPKVDMEPLFEKARKQVIHLQEIFPEGPGRVRAKP